MGDTAVFAIKIGLAVACTMLFLSAIITFLGFIVNLTASSAVGEVIGLLSVYLPFDAGTVFGTLSLTIAGVISFLVAHKIWDLTGHTYKMS